MLKQNGRVLVGQLGSVLPQYFICNFDHSNKDSNILQYLPGQALRRATAARAGLRLYRQRGKVLASPGQPRQEDGLLRSGL